MVNIVVGGKVVGEVDVLIFGQPNSSDLSVQSFLPSQTYSTGMHWHVL